MIWLEESEEIIAWLMNASARGGGFVSAFAQAAMRGDPENYPILRQALLEFVAKYPEYYGRSPLVRE